MDTKDELEYDIIAYGRRISICLIESFSADICSLQVPAAPLQREDGPPSFNQMWQNESHAVADGPAEQGIPTLIMWNYGGNDVAVEGSWDNWTAR